MKPWMKVALVAAPVAAVALPVGQIVWPVQTATTTAAADHAGHMAQAAGPTGLQIGLYLGYSAIEAIAFGMGVAFLLFGLPLVRRMIGETSKLSLAVYGSIAFMFMSWLPHGGWHRVISHNDIDQLLMIEYIFHAGSMIAAGLIATTLVRPLASKIAQPQPEVRKQAISMIETGYGTASS